MSSSHAHPSSIVSCCGRTQNGFDTAVYSGCRPLNWCNFSERENRQSRRSATARVDDKIIHETSNDGQRGIPVSHHTNVWMNVVGRGLGAVVQRGGHSPSTSLYVRLHGCGGCAVGGWHVACPGGRPAVRHHPEAADVERPAVTDRSSVRPVRPGPGAAARLDPVVFYRQ